MRNPTVCAVMLTRDRPEMARRAIRSFLAQTYENKRLLVFDTGDESAGYLLDDDGVSHHFASLCWQESTIGALRNEAIDRTEADIIIHMDDDDVSHPRRIEEQVALLQSSGAQVVGYNEALFWDTRDCSPCGPAGLTLQDGEYRPCPNCQGRQYRGAWLYSNPFYLLGASFCYWRSYWESRPFGDTNDEDTAWQQGKIGREFLGVSALKTLAPIGGCPPIWNPADPRLVCGIHGRNSSTAYSRESMEKNREWRRTPDLDEYAERTMRL